MYIEFVFYLLETSVAFCIKSNTSKFQCSEKIMALMLIIGDGGGGKEKRKTLLQFVRVI